MTNIENNSLFCLDRQEVKHTDTVLLTINTAWKGVWAV